MYIVIGVERHRDRFLEDTAYGPFPDYNSADAEADRLYDLDSNKLTQGSRRYDYLVRELVSKS